MRFGIYYFMFKICPTLGISLSSEEILNESASDRAYTPRIVVGSYGNIQEPYYEYFRFRSSSPLVPWGDRQLMIVYETVWLDQKEHQVHRLISLDKQGLIRSLSPPCFFKQLGDEKVAN